jgi:arylsulfatase A-like enzyme
MAPRKKAAATTRRAKRSSTDKPNVPIIWGDDIGWYNISAYNSA